MSQSTRPEGAHDAAFPFMHPSHDGEKLVYHPGLTKLEMFVIAEVMSGLRLLPGQLVSRAIAQMCAIEQRCNSCLHERHSVEIADQVFYTCTNDRCEMYGVNEALSKQGFAFDSDLRQFVSPKR